MYVHAESPKFHLHEKTNGDLHVREASNQLAGKRVVLRQQAKAKGTDRVVAPAVEEHLPGQGQGQGQGQQQGLWQQQWKST